MALFDITREISPGMVIFPGDRLPEIVRRDCGSYTVSDLTLSSHTGTHIDAPSHFIKGGLAVDQIPLTILTGPVVVADFTSGGSEIEPAALEPYLSGTQRLLLKTSYSYRDTFSADYPYLTPSAARLLISRGIRCIGTDSPSIEVYGGDGGVHRTLLENGCIIIELLDLSRVPEGTYTLVALPLRLKDLDGSPARVILLETERGEKP
jgi:arylformamidase